MRFHGAGRYRAASWFRESATEMFRARKKTTVKGRALLAAESEKRNFLSGRSPVEALPLSSFGLASSNIGTTVGADMKKQKPGILMPLFLTLLAGCATFSSGKKEFLPAAWLGEEKPSPRATPSQLTQESEEALKKKGFVAIGYISERVVTGTYWGSSKPPDKAESRDVTTGLLREAADRGGDVVILQKNNLAESSSVSKRGRALTWDRRSRTVLYQRSLGSGKGSIQDSKREYYSVPTSWETISGREYSVASSGTVWRHDPELGKKAGEKLAVIQREQAIMRRENEDKSAQITAYKKAYEEKGLMYQNDEFVSINIGGKYGFKDKNGKIIIEPQFTDSMWGFYEGVAVVSVGVKDEKKWGIINKAGKWVLRPSYKSMGRPSNGMVNVNVNNKCGYVNTTGQVVIAAQFSRCWQFSEGMAAVRQDINSKVGYIDKTGKIVIEPIFNLGGQFSDGLAIVLVDGKYGYIDTQGVFIIKPKFDNAEPFINGIARVKDGKIVKYITKEGEVFMDP